MVKKTAIFLFCVIITTSEFSIAKPPTQVNHMQRITVVNVPSGSVLPYKMEGKWKVFTLVAEPVNQVIYNKDLDTLTPMVKTSNLDKVKVQALSIKTQMLKGWGYNGKIPGPAIVVNNGDHVRVILENKLPEPTSIHWHGLVVPNTQDGAGGTTGRAALPGKSKTYQFTVHQVGTFMYHSGFNDTKQVSKGMAGFFIALPANNKNKGKYKDFAIMLDMFTLPTADVKPTVFSMDPNWFTFNGIVAPNFPVLKVKQGDKVRIRFGNVSNTSHPIHLHGYTFQIVGTEGGSIPKSARWPAATVNVAPGETRDIEFTANNPGLWRLHCHKLLHIVNDNSYWRKQESLGILPIGGMFTYFYVEPKQVGR